MPAVPIHPPHPHRDEVLKHGCNPLPQLLQTPSGLAILELQGTINIPLANEDDTRNADSSTSATAVGSVAFPDYQPDDPTGSTSWMKRVHLYIGRHQRLTGEVKKLSSPLAIIRRKPRSENAPLPHENEELEIAEIIYYKMLFSTRPEPVGD